GPSYATIGPRNGYQYNGKELNEELELGWNDFGARWYNASIGRWNAVDLLSSQTPNWSVYHYAYNSPINYLDILGLSGGNPNDYYDRSRQKVQDKFDSAIENNESAGENAGQYNFPKAYYTNAANLSTKELVSIFNNAAEIFSKNGLDGITFISVDLEVAKAHKQTYEYQMFLAIISKKNSEGFTTTPGMSFVFKNGRIGVYDEKRTKNEAFHFNYIYYFSCKGCSRSKR
ncbi:MAG: hypothetical protein HUU34_12930, partial [Saprospiraceae bacterium]|nr:hypothetical protein [Saprospiraceae bacterium]